MGDDRDSGDNFVFGTLGTGGHILLYSDFRKTSSRIREFYDFLPHDFATVVEKIRKDSRERLKSLGILPRKFV